MHQPHSQPQKSLFKIIFSILKDKRLYLYLFLDLLLIGTLYVSVTSFGDYIQTKSTIMNGIDFQNIMQQDQTQALTALTELKSFLIIFMIIIISLIIGTLTLYSLLQAIIWADIQKEKLHKIARWIPFHIILIFPLALFLLLIAAINLMLGFLISLLPQTIETILHNFLTLFLFALFIIFLNTIYKKYQERKLMWASIGDAITEINQNKKKLSLIAFLSSLAFMAISFLLFPFQLLNLSQNTTYFISIPLYLLIMGVLRLVVAEHLRSTETFINK